MLWYKGWLETRFKILISLGFGLFFVFMIRNANPTSPTGLEVPTGVLAFYWALLPLLLAGAGIRTQPAFTATRGLHGSTYFTLSMPVSRLRLLAVRAGLGMLETSGAIACLCCAAWMAIPAFRMYLTGSELLAYWLTVSVCASAFYFLSVLFATFLDEQWRIWASIFTVMCLRWLSTKAFVPPSVNIFRAMGASSPLFTHSFPWTGMGISLGVAAILFLAAARVVQSYEF